MNGRYNRKEGGFTLIEIAIVVVIIGLLLGGVLKGQELIRNARAHNIASQGSAVKAAILGFMDRYRALPGDYSRASVNIPDMEEGNTPCDLDAQGAAITNQPAGCVDKTSAGYIAGDNGNGDSRVGNQPRDFTVDPVVNWTTGSNARDDRDHEIAQVWKHLARSGFISGQYDGETTGIDEAGWTCPGATCMANVFQNGLFFLYDDEQTGVTQAATGSLNNQLWTGRGIPVEMIAELDRKVDDGEPSTGSFRVGVGFTNVHNTVDAPDIVGLEGVGDACVRDHAEETLTNGEPDGNGVGGTWDVASHVTNCGGVYSF